MKHKSFFDKSKNNFYPIYIIASIVGIVLYMIIRAIILYTSEDAQWIISVYELIALVVIVVIPISVFIVQLKGNRL